MPLLTAPRVALFAALLTSSPALCLAHAVPGDADKGREMYVLPGVLVHQVFPGFNADKLSALEIGVEASVHRFVPTQRSMFTQFGYGFLGQVQLGHSSLENGRGWYVRVAQGAQGTLGPLGVQAGPVVKVGHPVYGTTLGAFAGAFLTFGLASAGVQFEAPVVAFGQQQRQPILVTIPLTVKWAFPFEAEPRR